MKRVYPGKTKLTLTSDEVNLMIFLCECYPFYYQNKLTENEKIIRLQVKKLKQHLEPAFKRVSTEKKK